jgi:hypothetical protein
VEEPIQAAMRAGRRAACGECAFAPQRDVHERVFVRRRW